MNNEEINRFIHEGLFKECWHLWIVRGSVVNNRLTVPHECSCGFTTSMISTMKTHIKNPSYSTSISDAMKIPAKIPDEKMYSFINAIIDSYREPDKAGLCKILFWDFLRDPEAPLKICQAAIKIMEGE